MTHASSTTTVTSVTRSLPSILGAFLILGATGCMSEEDALLVEEEIETPTEDIEANEDSEPTEPTEPAPPDHEPEEPETRIVVDGEAEWHHFRSFSSHPETETELLKDIEEMPRGGFADLICIPWGSTTINVEVSCDFERCGEGPSSDEITVYYDGVILSQGSTGEELRVPVGCPFYVRARLASLGDDPTYEIHDYVIEEANTSVVLPLDVETGRLLSAVTLDGEPVDSTTILCMYDETNSELVEGACHVLGEGMVERTLSVGTYLVQTNSPHVGESDFEPPLVTIEAGQLYDAAIEINDSDDEQDAQ